MTGLELMAHAPKAVKHSVDRLVGWMGGAKWDWQMSGMGVKMIQGQE